MKKIASKKASLFIAMLWMIAVTVDTVLVHDRSQSSPPQNSVRSNAIPPSQQDHARLPSPPPLPSLPTPASEHQAEAPVTSQKPAEDLAAEHAKFLARYLNRRDHREPGLQTVAIAVVDDNGKYNQVVASAVAGQCKPESIRVLSSLFTPEFVSDGLFSNALTGSTTITSSLDLTNFVSMLLLGRQTVQYSSNPDLQNVITANMRLELNSLSIDAWGRSQGWAFTATGAGFNQGQARVLAEERLLKKIFGTEFVLGPSSSNGQ